LLITDTFPLADFDRAFAAKDQPGVHIKTAFVIEGA
jgi:hypothetical protein